MIYVTIDEPHVADQHIVPMQHSFQVKFLKEVLPVLGMYQILLRKSR